jgi:glycerol-3-phosphate O-acyltransferase/dihydroxyacetone phosphate acyltransferase
MGRAMDAVEDLVYQSLRLVLGTAARVYFTRIELRHLERLPDRGPLLVVANHPASLTDVLVLGPSLPRRLHFVAYSGLFEPWPLGVLLRLAGTVPVYRQQEGREHMHQNEEMFRACNAVLRAGQAVLIFPEGTSAGDRSVEKLRTGAARMAFAYAFDDRGGDPLCLLPIGIHFDQRDLFRSNVTLSVGRPLELESLRDLHARDPMEAVRALTARIQGALEKLILNIPSRELVKLVHDVERLYLGDLRLQAPNAPELALCRGISECIEFYRVHDRERLFLLWRAVNTYQRKLLAARLKDESIRDVPAARFGAEPMVGALLGASPAVVGALLHVVPYRLSGVAGLMFASADPTRTAFARMMAGLVVFPITYGVYAWLIRRLTHWTWGLVAVSLVACAILGLFSDVYFRWLRGERQHVRLEWLLRRHRRVIARLRVERRKLIHLLDRARDDYLEAIAAVESH